MLMMGEVAVAKEHTANQNQPGRALELIAIDGAIVLLATISGHAI